MTIIAVDDEQYALMSLEKAIKQALPDSNVVGFDSSAEALEFARNNIVNVAFLDINMPEINGLELAEELIKVYEKTNVIFVTGYSEHGIDAVNIHASGYLLKPITAANITKAMTKLRNPLEPPQTIDRGPLTLDIIAYKAYLEGKDLSLSKKEFSVLLLLVNKENQALSTDIIYQSVWGQQMINDRNAVQRTVSRLRKKLDENTFFVIRSVYGKGYMFEKKIIKGGKGHG